MARTTRRPYAFEPLEDRRLLAATAQVTGGKLVVTDDVAALLVLTQTAANTWSVTDHGAAVGAGSFSGVTGDVSVKTGSLADSLTINLQGFTAPKSLSVALGDGDNDLTIENGTLTANLAIAAGTGLDAVVLSGLSINGNSALALGALDNELTIEDGHLAGYLSLLTLDGDDTLTLGDNTHALAIDGDVVWNDRGGSGDALDVMNNVVLGHNLRTSAVNDVWLRSGSTLAGSLTDFGGAGVPNSLTLAGDIDGGVLFWGGSDVDTLDVQATSEIGRSLIAYLGAGNDLANVDGTIGGSLVIFGQAGDDTVNLFGNVIGSAAIWLGDGNDTLIVSGSIGIAGATSAKLVIDGGTGNDKVALRSTAVVYGSVQANLGAGDDSLALDDGASVAGVYISGGSGNDTYYGTLPRSGVQVRLVETMLPGPPPF